MNSRRRHLVVAGSVLAHAAGLALLLRAPAPAGAPADVGAISVSLFPGKAPAPTPGAPAAPAASRPPPRSEPPEAPPEPTEIEPEFVEASLSLSPQGERDPLADPVALSVAAASSGATGQTCQVTAWLQQALQVDPAVQAALPAIPKPARSVANAIMLWDGGWVGPRLNAADGVTTIRMAVIAGVRSAPAACQTQVVRGPELIILTQGAESTVLAIGSGEWRWGDLLAPDYQLTALATPAPRPCASPAILFGRWRNCAEQ